MRQTIETYAVELLMQPAPVLTEQGKALLAQAVLAVKLFYGERA